MEHETVSGPGTADGTQDPKDTAAEWLACAREFPRWYLWRGVAGHYYARVPRTSPPMVVRAPDAASLRDEITRAELSGRPVSSWSRRNRCA